MDFKTYKFRCSEIGKIMIGFDKPNLTEKQTETLQKLKFKETRTELQEKDLQELITKQSAPKSLSSGAITYIHELVNSIVYKYKDRVDSKYLDKGLTCEFDAINYINDNLFQNYQKFAEGKYSNEWLCTIGCDIKQGKIIRDIKCSWSKKTHPKTWQEAYDFNYECQVRAYMMIFDCDVAYVDHVLIDTPPELYGWEDASLHEMEDLTFEQRFTSIRFERDKKFEENIPIAVELARTEMSRYLETLKQNKNY